MGGAGRISDNIVRDVCNSVLSREVRKRLSILFPFLALMNLTAMAGMTDPILLANWIQQAVDSTTGRHVDLVFIQILANTISSIDLASIFLNVFFIILIALLTRTAVRIVDRMLVNYIPTVVSKVQMKMDETMQLMMRRLVSATIYVIGLMLIIYQIPQLQSLVTAILAGAGIAGLAIGFAAKDSLSNFTSSIFIAVFQPFRVGDSVDFRRRIRPGGGLDPEAYGNSNHRQ